MENRYILPDYANCGLNVASSVLRFFGAPCPHAPHPAVEALLGKPYKNIVLMLFDGLGVHTLEELLPADSFLRAHMAREMTAVFPSTTVAATTTIESGLSPCEHGWLGWSMYFSPIDRTVDVFTNRDSLTGEVVEGADVAQTFIPYVDICKQIEAAGRARAHIVSRYGSVRIDTLDELFDSAASLCRRDGPQYVYAYWNDPDHTMHDMGVDCDAVRDIVRDIDARVRDFCRSIADDTLVLVTADHGLLNTKQLYISDTPALADMCARVSSIEPRATAFFVKPECVDAFPEVFYQTYGRERFWLMTSGEAVARGLFGPGAHHPMFESFLGDYLSISIDCYSLSWDYTSHQFAAMHAGLTPREMRVPLIVGKR